MAKALNEQWRALVSHFKGADHGQIKELFNVESLYIDLSPSNPPWDLTWNAPGHGGGSFDIVIFAVGFGEEQESAHSESYWRNDHLHQLATKLPGRVLVSGCGDGGLTDTLRLCVRDFEHDQILSLLSGPWLERVRPKILEAELKQGSAGDTGGDRELNQFYRELSVEEPEELLRGRVQNLKEVVLNGRSRLPFDRGSASLNRFLVSRLMRLGLPYEFGEVQQPIKQDEKGQYTIQFNRLGNISAPHVFSKMVLRHGPAKPTPLQQFPDVLACLNLGKESVDKLRLVTDRTRFKIWRDEDFQAPREAVLLSKSASLNPRVEDPAHSPATLVGWLTLDREFFDKQQISSERELLPFFEGRDPLWRDIVSGRLAERQQVETIVRNLHERLDAPAKSFLSRIIGPGGEGKSTILMQAVRRLVLEKPELAVLWRDDPEVSLLADELIARLPRDRPVLLASDNGHELAPQLDRIMRTGRFRAYLNERTHPLHILLCSTELYWQRAAPHLSTWRQALEVLDPFRVQGLHKVDAGLIVGCYEALQDPVARQHAQGILANIASHDEKVAALVDSARHRKEEESEGAFLGALIEGRTGKSLETHVHSLMERMQKSTGEAGHNLLSLYLHVGAFQSLGLGGVDRDVLAQALDIRPERLQQLVREPLSTEIEVTGLGSSQRFKIRHDMLAKVALSYSRENDSMRGFRQEAYTNLVEAVSTLYPDGWKNPRLRRILFLSSEFVKREPELAVALAEAVRISQPNDLFLLSHLAFIHRESTKSNPSGAKRGATLLSEAYRQFSGSSRNANAHIRALIFEWATCVGLSDQTVESAAGNLFLALLSVSDAFSDEPLTHEQVTNSLAGSGRALMDLQDRGAFPLAKKGFAALTALKVRLKGNQQTTRFFDEFAKRADSKAIKNPDGATDVLEASLEDVWPLVSEELRQQLESLKTTASLEMLRANIRNSPKNQTPWANAPRKKEEAHTSSQGKEPRSNRNSSKRATAGKPAKTPRKLPSPAPRRKHRN
ncbi:hypothetical protein [Corallococcus aberystwythensis]|uniref:P-loop NTPase n=1 Tax=Corallococcus aberystwythensis TaxID=2316722 RepID=UPI001FC91B9A